MGAICGDEFNWCHLYFPRGVLCVPSFLAQPWNKSKTAAGTLAFIEMVLF